MDTEIIVALIALIGTLGGSLGGILVSSKLSSYRIDQLETKIGELAKALNKITEIETHVKILDVRVKGLEDDVEKHHPIGS